jgi:hypothetical protein
MHFYSWTTFAAGYALAKAFFQFVTAYLAQTELPSGFKASGSTD